MNSVKQKVIKYDYQANLGHVWFQTDTAPWMSNTIFLVIVAV